MALKKSELEAHRHAYTTHFANACESARRGQYLQAINAAMLAWEFADGMMQYERRFENREFKSIPAIDLVLTLAPLVFHVESLNRLQTLLGSQKRIDKYASDDLSQRLADARIEMWENHRLFSRLASNVNCIQETLTSVLGGNQHHWNSVIDKWQSMGLVRRIPNADLHVLNLETRMDEVVTAKCCSCGTKTEATKIEFLEAFRCIACQATLPFVIVF